MDESKSKSWLLLLVPGFAIPVWWVIVWRESPYPHVIHDPAQDSEDRDASNDGDGNLTAVGYLVAENFKHGCSLPAEGRYDEW